MYRVLIALFLMLALMACTNGKGKAAANDNAEQQTQQTIAVSETQAPVETTETTNQNLASPKQEQSPVSATISNDKPATPAPKPKQEGYQVTFLEIGAESCIPCRMMKPIMKDIAEEYPGVVKVVFHDLYKDRSIGQQYGIRVMPTQVFLDAKGKEFFRHEGFYPKDEMKAMLDKYLASLNSD
jgi:thioredoxin 1